MPCYSPITAWRDSKSGTLFFAAKPGTNAFRIPCGQCVGCRLERSRVWAVRCMHEASLHQENCFITLTYRDNPDSLNYRDFQLFMKRLRKIAKSVRFYMCGEYGEEFNRPHFHACLFGYNFPDRVRFGRTLYRSNILESLWPHGYSSIGSVTFESAAYVARYIMKKITGDAADDHYSYVDKSTGEVLKRTPEFCHMSLKPGIGSGWLDKYNSDVYPSDEVIVRGVATKPPRYYDKKLKRADSVSFDSIKSRRIIRASEKYFKRSYRRLQAEHTIVKTRIKSLVRNTF